MKGVDYSALEARILLSQDSQKLIDEMVLNARTVAGAKHYDDMLDLFRFAATKNSYWSDDSHGEDLINEAINRFWEIEIKHVRQQLIAQKAKEILSTPVGERVVFNSRQIIIDDLVPANQQEVKPKKPRFPWFQHRRRW